MSSRGVSVGGDTVELRPAVGLLAAVILLSSVLVAWLVWAVKIHAAPDGSEGGSEIWRWIVVGLWDAFALLGWAAVLWAVHCDVRTVVTDQGITRPSLRGTRTLRWRDVKSIRRGFQFFGIQLRSENERMTLSYVSYRDPGGVCCALGRLIREKIQAGEISAGT